MAWSKESRIKFFIVVDVIFFLIELIIGYTAHSLALVADAFHMLNDVISLCVGLWAVRVANTKQSSDTFTYGWARAEILGGLVNGVFLVALCMTIFLEAIQRFFEPQEVSNPKLVLIVGGIGLAFNILGLFVFHQPHGHSHDDHSHDELGSAEEGHVHAHDEAESHQHTSSDKATLQDANSSPGVAAASTAQPIERGPSRTSRVSVGGHSRRPASRSFVEDIPIHPSSIRDNIRYQARMGEESEESSYEEEAVDSHAPTEQSPLLSNGANSKPHRHFTSPQGANGKHVDIVDRHHDHHHTKPRPSGGGGHGHNHADMNIRGMFLHVLGDALGNVGVMTSALIIWLSHWWWKYYSDPAISLIITVIILKSAVPLIKDTAKPLLQAVPEGIEVDKIKEDIESLDGVGNVHHLHVWALTPTKRIATLDVTMDFDYEVEKYMALAREIKKCLHGFGIHSSTIQPEFTKHGPLCQLDCGGGGEAAMKCCTPGGGSGATSPKERKHSHADSTDHAGHSH